jgi:dipeptidase
VRDTFSSMCDSLVARGARTADGATLFAKNSDRRGREAQPFVQFPAAYHPRGSVVRCTHIEIDQVAETYRVMGHSPAWCWGFEHGVNEHGVAIGNHATWSREPLESVPGLIGMDLVRLGLERGRDAREALELIAALLERHGQGGSAFAASGDDGYQNSFVIADGLSAWVLETTDRGWAARAVDGAGLTNELTLGAEWQIGSRALERHALQQGYWKKDARLDFKAAYARDGWPTYLTERRQEASRRCLGGPPLTVAAMKAWLCDHGGLEGPPSADREFADPHRYSVCMHADPMSMTTASMVARLPEELGRRPWPVWISFATPCVGLFVPVYLDGVIPARLASAGPSAGEMDGTSASGPSAWEALRCLQERATTDFARSLPIVREGWKESERKIELERLRVEQEVSSLFATDRLDEGERTLSRFMEKTTDRLIDTAERIGRAL